MELKHWRLNTGWTQAELGERLGVEASAVSRWEGGERRPGPRHCGLIFRLTNGAVDAQDHQDAWEKYQAAKAARENRRWTALCPPAGVLPDPVANPLVA